MEKCFKLHGFPPGYQFRNKNSSSANQVSILELQPSASTEHVASVLQLPCSQEQYIVLTIPVSDPITPSTSYPDISNNVPIIVPTSIPETFSASSEPLRQSARVPRKPSYLQDYHCQLAFSSITPSSDSTANGSIQPGFPVMADILDNPDD
ncbi:hypothetical protein F0562_022204 [Nyssa sinensis]|uniref:Uncharacterized protein n=1 Tax=Nyssa sinensis TaxID=561372 RepID=A0A5J5BPX3_9ASTE|nr:hypothetical protein F0562_022204 [Nyssa sinensis]